VNPAWLYALIRLIERHPDAMAWSVYRSAHVKYHAPIREEGDDIEVRSLCGHGMTISRQKWLDWGINWVHGAWNCPSGDTLDLQYAHVKPGERWCTKVSYIDHCAKVGVHQQVGMPEYGLDFAGVQ